MFRSMVIVGSANSMKIYKHVKERKKSKAENTPKKR